MAVYDRSDEPVMSQAGLPVLGIGELVWDILPAGPSLGGAPFNVVAHLQRLGHPAWYMTAVGDDELGHLALAQVRELGVNDSLIQMLPSVATGTAGVELDESGHATFDISSPAAYEDLAASPGALIRVGELAPNAIVFGTGAQQFPSVRRVTSAILGACTSALRLYDVNLRGDSWTAEIVAELAGSADVLKLNESELELVATALLLPRQPAVTFAAAAAERFGLRAVCVTRGSHGAMMWTPDGDVVDEGFTIDVADTVGAGDAFAAGLLHGLLAEWPLGETLELANALGSLIASKDGAIPAWSLPQLRSILGTRGAVRSPLAV